MPAKLSGYEKVINKCQRVGWTSYPPYDINFDYDKLYSLVKYRVNGIKIGITHCPNNWDEYLNLILKYKGFKRGVYLEKLVFINGNEIGTKLFEEYKRKQAYTNTFEYKNKKYGFTKSQFDEYNKSRAVTLENLIKKYGESQGTLKYNEYCKVQAFTNTEEYLGTEKYKEVNNKKSHTLKNYILRYGEDKAEDKLLEFYEKITSKRSYSKISQECFYEIQKFLTEEENKSTYFASKNKEYCLIHQNGIFLYDFVCTKLNLCIEYHGDHYHGNPKFYRPDDYLRGRGCTNIKVKSKWEYDKQKADLLKNMRGYDTVVIWDSDWRENKDDVIYKLNNHICKLKLCIEN